MQSNPPPEVARLLRSASLDVPSAAGKAETKARALAALREQQLGSTTQLTAFALGDTVTRLLGTVTLAGKPATSMRLAMRGAALGAVLGAAALGIVATHRMLALPTSVGTDVATGVAPESVAFAPKQSVGEPEPKVLTLADAERAIAQGKGSEFLAALDRLQGDAKDENGRNQTLLLRIRTLIGLGRMDEAKHLIEASLPEAKAEQAEQLRAIAQELRAK